MLSKLPPEILYVIIAHCTPDEWDTLLRVCWLWRCTTMAVIDIRIATLQQLPFSWELFTPNVIGHHKIVPKLADFVLAKVAVNNDIATPSELRQMIRRCINAESIIKYYEKVMIQDSPVYASNWTIIDVADDVWNLFVDNADIAMIFLDELIGQFLRVGLSIGENGNGASIANLYIDNILNIYCVDDESPLNCFEYDRVMIHDDITTGQVETISDCLDEEMHECINYAAVDMILYSRICDYTSILPLLNSVRDQPRAVIEMVAIVMSLIYLNTDDTNIIKDMVATMKGLGQVAGEYPNCQQVIDYWTNYE